MGALQGHVDPSFRWEDDGKIAAKPPHHIPDAPTPHPQRKLGSNSSDGSLRRKGLSVVNFGWGGKRGQERWQNYGFVQSAFLNGEPKTISKI